MWAEDSVYKFHIPSLTLVTSSFSLLSKVLVLSLYFTEKIKQEYGNYRLFLLAKHANLLGLVSEIFDRLPINLTGALVV